MKLSTSGLVQSGREAMFEEWVVWASCDFAELERETGNMNCFVFCEFGLSILFAVKRMHKVRVEGQHHRLDLCHNLLVMPMLVHVVGEENLLSIGLFFGCAHAYQAYTLCLNIIYKLREDEEDNEPFAVPTAGAFYMHDDRFRDNSGRPHRRAFGGSKLWELKDDGKWGHDKFEEMNMQERYFEEWSRSSRGYNGGRGKARGGFPRGSRSRASDGNNHKNIAPKTVRGRGPRRYQPLDSEDETPTQHKRAMATSTTNAEPNPVPVKKAASNLSSASPFYPSSFSNKEITLTLNGDATNESANRIRHSVMEDGFTMQQGKNVSGSVVMDKLHIDGSFSAVTSKQLSNLHMPTASSSMIANQTTQSRGQGKGLRFSGPTSFQPSPTHNQVNKVPSPSQTHASQRNPIQSRRTTQLLGQHPVNLSEDSPPKSNLSVSEFEPGDSDSTPESVKSKTVLVGKGKGMVQGSVRAPFLCGGALVMESGENVGTGHDDQKFPASPAFLPVMQFRGQHPGGMGVPNVGMAFQRYVAQPQHSSGNSEMTCKNNGNTPSNEWKPEQRSELLSDAFSQRQNKPRRYSEMNFGQ
ncbi:hypothetical protein Nepgr_005500 [Nepenthes gracilis]|uniref:Btz domain-containing protein n=1 Tax=Nepenthes gracilis TaxID=150966 RepID=A0AAD3XGN5_NEPGR|nr:hypothetical protein Nepgr_005500 [Nepenthes gracilis]